MSNGLIHQGSRRVVAPKVREGKVASLGVMKKSLRSMAEIPAVGSDGG